MLLGLCFLITSNAYASDSAEYHKLPPIIQTQSAEHNAVVYVEHDVFSSKDPPTKGNSEKKINAEHDAIVYEEQDAIAHSAKDPSIKENPEKRIKRESTKYHKLPPNFQTQYGENDAVVLSARDPPTKEHFPAMPELPSDYDGEQDQFVLVSETNLTQKREQYLLSQDVVGIPLGKADELYFTNEVQSSPPKEDQPTNAGEQGEHFEGDISGVELISKSESSSSILLNGKNSKNAIKNTYQKWPKAEIPYAISQRFSSYDRSVIRKSMTETSKVSCIKWRPKRSSDKDYVHILRDVGCYSRVGKVGGPQILSLGKQ